MADEEPEKPADDSCHSVLKILDLRGTAMTVDEVATLLNVSPRHIYQLVKDGKMPHFKIGGVVRLNPDEVKAWLDGRRG